MKIKRSLEFVRKGHKLLDDGEQGIKERITSEKNHYRPFIWRDDCNCGEGMLTDFKDDRYAREELNRR